MEMSYPQWSDDKFSHSQISGPKTRVFHTRWDNTLHVLVIYK